MSVAAQPHKKMDDVMIWLDEVLDALKLSQVDLLGASLGRAIAANYALHAPSRVRRMVLMAPGDTLLPMRLAFYLSALRIVFSPTRKNYERFFRQLGPTPMENKERYEQYMQDILRNAVIERRIFGLPKIPKLPILRDEQLRAISAKTRVLIGEHAMIYDAKKALARAAHIPNVKTVLVPGAGHDITWSQPDRLNAENIEFLRP